MTTGASMNRGASRQDYETPADFMRAVEKRFGVMSVDLAARSDNTKAPVWIDEEKDSLLVDWSRLKGNLWLNPPFSNIAPWAEKCAVESAKGARVFLLTPASVGSNWFSNFVHKKATVIFLNGRITFVGSKDTYPKDCILSCFGYGESHYEVWKRK